MFIYKVLRAQEWLEFQATGSTLGAPIDLAHGYVHFSTGLQLAKTLRRHFPGETDLHLLAMDVSSAGSHLRWEVSRGGDLYPHLYRALHLDDIVWNCPLESGDQFLDEPEDPA